MKSILNNKQSTGRQDQFITAFRMLMTLLLATFLLANHASAQDSLANGATLNQNQSLLSLNGSFRLTLQGDGNLVLRDVQSNASLWSTASNSATRLIMQPDGNLVLRNAAGASVWSSGTANSGTPRLALFNNGALALMQSTTVVKAIYGTVSSTTFNLTVNNGTGGGSYPAGRLVTITANAAPTNQDFDRWSVTTGSATIASVSSATTTLTMPAGNVTVAANYKAKTQVSGRLPLEVLGRRTSASIVLNLPNITGVNALYVQCHSCGYGDATLDKNAAMVKASVRINGGTWISLKHYTGDNTLHGNASIAVMKPESAYGSIGGAFHTVRFTVPITGLVAGNNTIEFRHTNPDKRSLGFRIVDLDVMRAGTRVLGKGAIALDNPANWVAPLTAEADRAAGATLWSRRESLVDPAVAQKYGILKGQSAAGRITAACSDCHTKDGRDLKYFRFSNDAIIERSVFHGLSETQGKQIAAYIRKLTTPAPANAWPWNPPYQPGTGIDARNVTDWAAGAGVDAVLNSDAQMKGYLFPGNANPDGTAVGDLVNLYGNLNMRQLPIALQFPDWNAWLPRLHPLDGFDKTDPDIYKDRNGVATPGNVPYFQYQYQQAANAKNNASLDDMAKNIRLWLKEGANCFTQNKDSGADWRPSNSNVLRSLGIANAPLITASNCNDIYDQKSRLWAIEDVKMGLAAWINVKQWEVIHGNNLEQPRYPAITVKGKSIDVNEKFGWGLEERNVFNRAAHFLSYNSITFINEDPLVSAYGSTVWYHLQMVIDSGYRKWMPNHFSYTLSHLGKLDDQSTESQSFRFWATMAKMRQQHTNGQIGVEAGFSMHNAQPFHLYASTANTTAMRSGVGTTLWRLFANEILRDFLEQAEGTNYTHWDQATDLEDVQDYTSAISPGSGDWQDQDHQGDSTARVIPLLRSQVGVDEALLTRLNTWSRGMWRNWVNR